MSLAEAVPRTAPATKKVSIVDCDVHLDPKFAEDFAEFMPEPYRTRYYSRDLEVAHDNALFYPPPQNLARLDAIPPSGGPLGTDPEYVELQLLQQTGIDYAVIGPLGPRAKHWDAEYDAAFASALNSWLAARWLDGPNNWHGRYRGSIHVSPMDPAAAVREIHKWAEHPYFVSVFILADGLVSWGQPQYREMLRTAAHYKLPVATHLLRHTGIRSMSPVGFPSYHLEILPAWSLPYVNHLASLLFEGVFEEIPDLKYVNVEGGTAWIAPLLWRLDRHWELLKDEIPNCRRRPSEYIREHVRWTTQPLEEPSPPRHLNKMLEWAHADEVLMFSSDYPHYDYDDPSFIRSRLPVEWRERILGLNAIELYGLPTERPLDRLDTSETPNRFLAKPRTAAEAHAMAMPE